MPSPSRGTAWWVPRCLSSSGAVRGCIPSDWGDRSSTASAGMSLGREHPSSPPKHPARSFGRVPRCVAASRPRGRKGVRGGGGAGVPRQSASEREKLRMRRLAQALLRLRHYLPPALAPAGQTLTKIETLRLATRYIAHLSALLGLGRGAPAPRHCPLCPRGLGCCQDTEPRDASPPGTAGWGSPPMARTPPELHGAPGMGTGAWGSPLCSPAVGTPPEVLGEMVLEQAGGGPGSPWQTSAAPSTTRHHPGTPQQPLTTREHSSTTPAALSCSLAQPQQPPGAPQ
uniref:Uncharacterized protein n=1 Tax=Corvus moneduloides TaxID=1196302 RepID=A0A8C3DB57_CORMO